MDPRADQTRSWLAALRADRADVFEQIFHHYWPSLWQFARRSVPADTAEDIVQEVMADLWRRRHTIDADTHLTRYLFRAIRNRVQSHWRHEYATQQVTDTPEPGLNTAQAIPSPHHQALASDITQQLADALRPLPEIQRAVLTLRWVHGLTYDDIAHILSISPDAARQHASRTQRVIRPLLEKFRDE